MKGQLVPVCGNKQDIKLLVYIAGYWKELTINIVLNHAGLNIITFEALTGRVLKITNNKVTTCDRDDYSEPQSVYMMHSALYYLPLQL